MNGSVNSSPSRLQQDLKRTDVERYKTALGRQQGSYRTFVFVVPRVVLRTEYMRKKSKPSSGTTLRIRGHKDFLMEDHSVERNSL